jgi:flagellar assembly protein FliH
MTSSRSNPFRNVPPPPGSKASTPYTRFIPREELGDFESWKPGSFAGGAQGASAAQTGAARAAAAPAAPAEPTAAEWQQRIDAARQAGYQDGYRDGLSALENFKQSFAQQATAQIGTLLDALDAQYEQLDARVAQAVAQTAVQLARQVLRAELTLNPAIVSHVAGEAINAVMLSARHIAVHVNPVACSCKAMWGRSTRASPNAGRRPPRAWATIWPCTRAPTPAPRSPRPRNRTSDAHASHPAPTPGRT